MTMTTSPDTLLRRVKRLKNEPAPPPRVVGIDDWAWRKGQRYGTLVVDLERGDVIDLLPDRDAETVAAWLKAHPGFEMRCGPGLFGAMKDPPQRPHTTWSLRRLRGLIGIR
jgi:transposase